MKCPYRPITITEKVIAYAIGNNDFIRSTVSFPECLEDDCPHYWNYACQKALAEADRIRREGEAE